MKRAFSFAEADQCLEMVLQTRAPQLDDKAAQALADLLPLLACGEEAAAIVFGRLQRNGLFNPSAVNALRLIEAEENVHDEMLTAMAISLPPSKNGKQSRRAARKFQLQLCAPCPVEHLARIAAIDAGVCTILARLTAAGRPLRKDSAVIAKLRRIHRDEAKHVAVSRNIALRHGRSATLRNGAAEAREELGRLVALGGAAFDDLMVDPDQLVRDVSHLPNGLL